jgi:hypothetical protein
MDRDAVNLFDLRRIIGGLFVALGLLLTILGLFDSQEEIDKAAGVNINLWSGLGMLALGLLFLVWAFARPLRLDEPGGRPGGDGERPGGDRDAGA